MKSLMDQPCAGPIRDLDGWDSLFNMFVECGEDWMKCDLVTQNKSVREQSRMGSWALMSKVVTHLNVLISNYSSTRYIYIYKKYIRVVFNICIYIYIY